MRLPEFLIKKVPKRRNIQRIREILGNNSIHTVCESAKCPNIGECFSQNTLTFMILGDTCTRRCKFCGVEKGIPPPPNPGEPKQIAEAVKKLGLDYVVITSITRDDLPDGGANHFAKTINALRITHYALRIEVLIPDFQGSEEALKTVLEATPYILNHNLETIPRLYPKIRPQANYQRSLTLLKRSKEIKKEICTKSGFMLGFGERKEEVFELLHDLKAVDCDIVTIGQYLPPSKQHIKAERYVEPKEFEEYKIAGDKLGLKVSAGPFVRSSYQARELR